MKTTRHVNKFSDFPWHKEDCTNKEGGQSNRYGYFLHSTEAYHYLQAYTDHFNIMDLIVLNTRVVEVKKRDSDWIVHTKDKDNAT